MKLRKIKLTANEILYHWRRAQGMSQGALAKRLGIHQTTVSKMEKAKIPIPARVREMIGDGRDMLDGPRASILRRRKGMTLSQVGEEIGVNDHRLSEMERGLRIVDDAYVRFLTAE